jgi:phospholipase/carboxylesterase
MSLHLHRAEGHRRATRLLFLVHNYGGSEVALATVGTLLDPDGRFAVVCPRGAIGTDDVPGGASFYRIDRATQGYDEPSFAAAVAALDDALDRACAEGGFERSSAVVGGYSQGAGLALALAYRRGDRPRPAGVIAFAPPIHPVSRVEWDLPAGRSVPAFIGHGHDDPVFPATASQRFAAELAAAGADATWRGYPSRHQLTLDQLVDAAAWLAGR